MSAPYNVGELRLVQSRVISSAANAESINFAVYPVPPGKLWCILAFGYYPSVAETQVVAFSKYNTAGEGFGLLNPASMALNPAIATFIEQGMEYTLLPGEYIQIMRGGHTAGSLMNCFMEFVEIDMPLYTYEEPQIVKRNQLARSSVLQQLGGGAGGGRPRGIFSGSRGPRTRGT